MTTHPKSTQYPKWNGNPEILSFIADFEQSHFRTTQDSGANPGGMFLWNMVRIRAGLPGLTLDDLPRYDADKRRYVYPQGSKLTGRVGEK